MLNNNAFWKQLSCHNWNMGIRQKVETEELPVNSGAGSREGEEAEQSSGVQHAQQHLSRARGLFKQTSNRQPPASPNSPLFPAPFLPLLSSFLCSRRWLVRGSKKGKPWSHWRGRARLWRRSWRRSETSWTTWSVSDELNKQQNELQALCFSFSNETFSYLLKICSCQLLDLSLKFYMGWQRRGFVQGRFQDLLF